MKKYKITTWLILPVIVFVNLTHRTASPYFDLYSARLTEFRNEQRTLITSIRELNDFSESNTRSIREGIKSYKANCARCHGIFGKGKDSIPNFSKEQTDDYTTTFLAGDKQNHAVMSKMTEEELNNVFLFITNVKR